MTKMRSTPTLEELWVARERLITEMAKDREDFFPARMAQIILLRLINQAIDHQSERGAR